MPGGSEFGCSGAWPASCRHRAEQVKRTRSVDPDFEARCHPWSNAQPHAQSHGFGLDVAPAIHKREMRGELKWFQKTFWNKTETYASYEGKPILMIQRS